MDLEKLKGKNVNPIVDVLHKFKYSFDGFAHCFKNETSFRFEALGIIAIIVCGIIFKISFYEWVLALISMLTIVQTELLNTAVEATVDMVTKEFHPLAKIAKDCGSAATCTATLIALTVNLIIFVPKFFPFLFK